LALAISAGWGVACGGSSSETPPPLEPDPKRLVAVEPEAAATPAAPGANSDALQQSTEPYSADGAEFGLETEPAPGGTGMNPALQTWGSGGKVPPLNAGRPRPAAAPPP